MKKKKKTMDYVVESGVSILGCATGAGLTRSFWGWCGGALAADLAYRYIKKKQRIK